MTEGDDPTQWIVVTEDARTLPVVEVLTGRGFITGKSGSGKSNTASVFAEELLEANYNMLIVDTEGEYWGLKERYDLLHVGNSETCDVQINTSHAEKLASIALDRNLPTILDVSEFDDLDEANAIIHDVISELFHRENDVRKPFLLIIEEIQEYLPQSGGKDELAELLLRVAKRGRKRGLGLCGISQRPAAVDKDYITQCDWLVWHRLTWENDLAVVERLLGDEIADDISDLADGEAYLMTDWDGQVERVQFRRKKTFDAGATPGLEEYDRPDLKSVGQELISELGGGAGAAIEAPGQVEIPDSRPEASEDPVVDITDQPREDDLDLIVQDIESRTIETDDPEELRRLLQEERKRTEILQDEVRELKQILENVRTGRPQPSTSPDEGGARESRAAGHLFEEPKNDGPAGVVMELGLLVTYLVVRAVRAVTSLGLPVSRRLHQWRQDMGASNATGYPIADPQRPDRTAEATIAILIGLILVGLIGAAFVFT